MNFFWMIFDFILSIFIGFYINLNITSEIIVYFFSGNHNIYLIIFFLALIMQIFFVFSTIRLFRNKYIDPITFKVLLTLYIIIMFVLLFGRQEMEIFININPLYIFDFSKDNFYQNILNIVFFMPIGYLIKNLSINNAIKYILIGLLLIEALQLITKRGIFDINDIILNSLSILITYYICKRFNINLIK